jgi:coenzyme F420-reducing hydrogenase alpha subunit
MKQNQEFWSELGIYVAIAEYCDSKIEEMKTVLREMEKSELNDTYVMVSRKDNTTSTYPEGYKIEKSEMEKLLKEKYKDSIIKTTKTNYTITLKATKLSQTKADIITSKIATLNKGQLKELEKQLKREVK